MSESTAPDTVVLVHGLWMTPRSWQHWVAHYEAKGLRVVTPAYPGFEIEVEALRADPSVIARQTITGIVDHVAGVVAGLDRPPVVIGHSFGGTVTQLVLARGLGAAGVVIDSAPTQGVRGTPLSQAKAVFPVLRSPANRRKAVGLTPAQFHYAFANTLPRAASDEVWSRYHIPAPGSVVWGGVLANFRPGRGEAWVDYRQDRAPLLFLAGGADHIMPPSVNRANARKYAASPAVTDYEVLEGRSHWTCGEPGWEAVADRALAWALDHATATTKDAR